MRSIFLLVRHLLIYPLFDQAFFLFGFSIYFSHSRSRVCAALTQSMVLSTVLQQPPIGAPSHPQTIGSSCACRCANSREPSPSFGPSLASYALRSLTGSTSPTQVQPPLPTLQRLRKSPYTHDLSQFLKPSSSSEEDGKQE